MMKLEQIFGIIANEGFTYYFIARFLPGQNTIHHTPRVAPDRQGGVGKAPCGSWTIPI